MPVVHVRANTPREGFEVDKALSAIATAVAEAASCAIGSVWCTFTPVAVQTIGTETATWEERILYLEILMKARGRDTRRDVLGAVGPVAATVFDVKPENVWAHATDIASWSVFAGGRVI